MVQGSVEIPKQWACITMKHGNLSITDAHTVYFRTSFSVSLCLNKSQFSHALTTTEKGKKIEMCVNVCVCKNVNKLGTGKTTKSIIYFASGYAHEY